MTSLAQLLCDDYEDYVPGLTETYSPLIQQGHVKAGDVEDMVKDIDSVVFEWCEVQVNEEGT